MSDDVWQCFDSLESFEVIWILNKKSSLFVCILSNIQLLEPSIWNSVTGVILYLIVLAIIYF